MNFIRDYWAQITYIIATVLAIGGFMQKVKDLNKRVTDLEKDSKDTKNILVSIDKTLVEVKTQIALLIENKIK